nr:opsin-5 isoform X2 [Equus asinus]
MLSYGRILSTFGNGYVLYMSSRRKKKLRPAEIMTINLAICDLGISVVGKPFTIISCFCHRWVFGWIGCRWYGWAGFFFGCGSLITMTAVSLDRYLKICYLSYGVWLKRKHAYICLAVIWAYASFWTTMPLVGLGDYVPEPFGTSCTLDWWLAQASVGGQIFILNILFFCLLLPTAVIVFSYVKIIAKVKSSSKEVAHFDSRIHGSHVLEVKLTKAFFRLIRIPASPPRPLTAPHQVDTASLARTLGSKAQVLCSQVTKCIEGSVAPQPHPCRLVLSSVEQLQDSFSRSLTSSSDVLPVFGL